MSNVKWRGGWGYWFRRQPTHPRIGINAFRPESFRSDRNQCFPSGTNPILTGINAFLSGINPILTGINAFLSGTNPILTGINAFSAPSGPPRLDREVTLRCPAGATAKRSDSNVSILAARSITRSICVVAEHTVPRTGSSGNNLSATWASVRVARTSHGL